MLVLYLLKQISEFEKHTQMRKLVQLAWCTVNHRYMQAAGRVPTVIAEVNRFNTFFYAPYVAQCELNQS